MSKIFLSHSSFQKNLVDKIVSKIGRDRCIYDKYSFEAGMDNLDEILIGLENTDLFVVLLSDEALNSYWVQTELAVSKKLILLNSIKQFLPIIIDDKINYLDDRIPSWIRSRNLKTLIEPYLIIKKIEQNVRDIILENNPTVKAREELFVGRNHLMEEFENQILSTDAIRPVSFIASGVEGIGRRTFMKRALTKTRHVPELYEPISIYLDAKESIEDFIIKIEALNGSLSDDTLLAIKNMEFSDKVEHAICIVTKLINNNEKLFILDSGCVIQPTKHIAEWFLIITNDERLNNTLSIILVSRWRPNPSFIVSNKRIKSIHVDALSEKDREKLFVQYSDILGLRINKENSDKLLHVLNGIPSQVHFALDLVKQSSIEYVLKNINDIVQYEDAKVFYLIEEIQKDSQRLDILILISKVDFISYDLLYSIIGRTEANEKTLEDFFIMGIFDTFGGFSEHIRVNFSIADYIRRSKFIIPSAYKNKLRIQMKAFLAKQNVSIDVSELLLNVKNALSEGLKIPDKYFLPSFVLKSIVDMYYQRKYQPVISLADNLLQNSSKMDYAMEREITYWLCLALAREKSSRFELEVRNIDGPEHDFLYGFYYRRKYQTDRALEYLKKALLKSPHFPRAKRELVNVLLSKGHYAEALLTAKENYENAKTNVFHIQAYFICLIRANNISGSEIKVLKHLLDSVRKTNDRKAEDLYSTMRGEYDFYINKDVTAAIKVLRESLDRSQFKYYPYKALHELYMKQGQFAAAETIKNKYDRDLYDLDEVEDLVTIE